jgi:hypothetical protein
MLIMDLNLLPCPSIICCQKLPTSTLERISSNTSNPLRHQYYYRYHDNNYRHRQQELSSPLKNKRHTIFPVVILAWSKSTREYGRPKSRFNVLSGSDERLGRVGRMKVRDGRRKRGWASISAMLDSIREPLDLCLEAVDDTFEVVEQVRTRSETRPALGWTTATPDEVCETFDGAGCDGMSYPGQITKRQSSVRMIDQSAWALDERSMLDWRYQ